MRTFERETAVTPMAPGRFRARLHGGWRIALGPNGGYMAAVLLRAIQASVADPERAPRSLTVHFVARPEGEEVEVVTTEERVGRSLTTMSARMVQGGRVIAVGIAALSLPRRPREDLALDHARFPAVIPVDRAAPWSDPVGSPAAAFHEHFEIRWAIPETPRSGSSTARSAAWVRMADPVRPDGPLLALYADALPPAVFALARGAAGMGPVPTIDLTIHFRAPLPVVDVAPDDFLLLDFTTRVVADGFLEEDGEIWTAGGVLLAHSRQLAILA